MIPIDFRVTCSKVKVIPLFSAQCVDRSISFDRFTWSITNSVQGLRPASRWSILIFRSHVQRSRSNHSFEPIVLSAQYLLISCLLASDRFCFYREDKPEFRTTGGIYVSETFLVYNLLLLCLWGQRSMSYISDCVVLHFTVIYLYFQNIKSLVQKVKIFSLD